MGNVNLFASRPVIIAIQVGLKRGDDAMNHLSVGQILCCPQCKADLKTSDDKYFCASCGVDFPVIAGIPDFRFGLPDKQKQKEMSEVSQLLRIYNNATFEELLTAHIKQTTNADLIPVEMQYEMGWVERGEKELFKINNLLNRYGSTVAFPQNIEGEIYLDVGCGKGAMLMTMAPNFSLAVGVDFSLVYLVLAKKLAEQTGAGNTFLFAARNEYMPFKNEAFHFITALDVIEHIDDQPKGVNEDFRILAKDGYLFINSPNRYSLFAPEDHVRLWWIGFLPRAWMQPYIRMVSGRSYKGVRLLSYFEIKSMITRHSNRIVEAGVMFDPDKTILTTKEKYLKTMPIALFILNHLFKFFVPSFHFLAQKR